jgi:decaprenyl-phosphate phosphoribosyltransferase
MTHQQQAVRPSSGAGRRARPLLVGCVETARPRQWTKNVLVFAAPCTAGVLGHPSDDLRALAAFVLLCMVSSGIYFINDALDVHADRLHPVKHSRPVAAGLIPTTVAMAVGTGLATGATLLSVLVAWRLTVVIVVYVSVQIAYNLRLKQLPVWDLACVTSGFVLRAIAGAVAVGVPVSQWFLIVATFGSLLMVTGKRLAEQVELGDAGGAHRRTLGLYTAGFLRTVVAISASGATIAYCLWAFDLQTALRHHANPIWFELSIVPFLVALLHYTYRVEQGDGARPERLALSDRSLQLLGFSWLVLLSVGVYGR